MYCTKAKCSFGTMIILCWEKLTGLGNEELTAANNIKRFLMRAVVILISYDEGNGQKKEAVSKVGDSLFSIR